MWTCEYFMERRDERVTEESKTVNTVKTDEAAIGKEAFFFGGRLVSAADEQDSQDRRGSNRKRGVFFSVAD